MLAFTMPAKVPPANLLSIKLSKSLRKFEMTSDKFLIFFEISKVYEASSQKNEKTCKKL